MLLWFAVTNFRSIKERQFISLVASKDSHLKKQNVIPGSNKLINGLKGAAVYGANASGKSTLFLALEALRKLVQDSANYQHGQLMPVTPFLLSETTSQQPCVFEICFVAEDGVRYEYGCALTPSKVEREWLVAYPQQRPQRWFIRDHTQAPSPFPHMVSEKAPGSPKEWWFGPNFDGDSAQQKLWQSSTRDNALFLSTAIQLNNTQLKAVFEWLVRDLIVVVPNKTDMNPWLSIELLKSQEGQELVMELMRAADLGITKLEVDEIATTPELNAPSIAPNHVRIHIEHPANAKLEKAFVRSANVYAWHETAEGTPVAFDIALESDGTLKLFEFAGGIIRAMQLGGTLCIDELDRSLHPHITRFLVELFHGPVNTRNAQLVFSTHDTTLMDPDLLRRDQIWFVEKDKQSETHLYPLLDYSPRKGEALERGYLKGRYGAVPIIGQVSK